MPEGIGERWRACRAGAAAAAERRPRTAWAGAVLGVGAAAAVPGCVLGRTLAYLSGPEPVYWFLALPFALLMFGAAALAGYAVRDVARRRLGWSARRSAVTAVLLGSAGSAPWLVPHGPSVWRAGQAPGWAVAWYGAGLLVLPAAAVLLVPGRRTRAAAAAGCLLLAVVWAVARHAWLDAETHASYQALGSPPRSLLRLVDWQGAVPAGVGYQDGRVSVEYDEVTPLPVPDGSRVATLVTERLPDGSGADFPCAEGARVSAAARAAAGAGPDRSTACRPLGGGLFRAGDSTLVRRDGRVLLVLVAAGDMSEPRGTATMIRVLHSEHTAADAEIRDLTPAQD